MNSSSFKKIKKETLSESIINQIKDLILRQELKLGDRLPSERALAELLGVSRPPVREALHALGAMGLIEIRSGEGTFLCQSTDLLSKHLHLTNLVTRYDTAELVEARRALESKIVGLAALRRTPDLAKKLQKALEEGRETLGQAELFLKSDFKFHMLIAKASRNRVLAEMLWTTRDLLLDINRWTIKRPGQMERALQDHQAIMEAVVGGRADQAEAAMNQHLNSLVEAVEYVLEQQGRGETAHPPLS